MQIGAENIKRKVTEWVIIALGQSHFVRVFETGPSGHTVLAMEKKSARVPIPGTLKD
jgi:hypothetical protein